MTSESIGSRADGPGGTDALAALAVLGDTSRRRLLEFVRRARRPVTREEASAAVGISRKLAAFHLDKLVASGLLQARHGGHGPRRVGRAPKVYEAVPHALAVSLPPRRHDLLASLLAEAVAAQRPAESAREAALRVARDRGEALGAAARGGDVGAFLESLGFEPADAGDGRTVLHNCPFHPVAAEAPDLVCGMNHAFLCGYLAAAGERGTTAVPAPRADACCVELRTGHGTVDGEESASGGGPAACGREPSG
ncbi:helix-turn-helix transcriptional regulator [Streptomyces echinoruber]|uniref:ArsR family transcriptional regulator n=1 Tax=Streptomyces echinoruber TaxID=68898 RepID=A0A918VEZ9_9ACTN|nr:transcriptional regulator [Streptomyces echinoruber]GGZ91726.1 ArsR family transcriptional regulator [Streptomyces echinoruber]